LKIKFDIKNLTAFNKSLKKRFTKDALFETKRKMNRSVDIVRNHVVESIQRGAKSGETYELYNPRRTHTASAPDQPPATDTGFLVSNVSTQVKTQGKKVIGQIVSSAPYSVHLEFGTTNMKARPFMQPALEKNKRKIQRIFREGKYIK
jgi:HK97 gp10 family phage protein